MLSSGSRLRRGDDFRFVMRQGTRAGSRTAVVYFAQTGDALGMAGFAVSRAVGGAVVRNRIKRRLRAVLSGALVTLPPGSQVVVRALPDAAAASFEELERDVTGALGRAVAKAGA